MNAYQSLGMGIFSVSSKRFMQRVPCDVLSQNLISSDIRNHGINHKQGSEIRANHKREGLFVHLCFMSNLNS